VATYTPDRWVKVRITNSEGVSHERILASWYGGFAGSDSWKLSSGIESVDETDTYYDFHNASGSIYRCYKNSFGTSSYSHSVFLSYAKGLEEIGSSMVIIDDEPEQPNSTKETI
jgi:hypothetical protein